MTLKLLKSAPKPSFEPKWTKNDALECPQGRFDSALDSKTAGVLNPQCYGPPGTGNGPPVSVTTPASRHFVDATTFVMTLVQPPLAAGSTIPQRTDLNTQHHGKVVQVGGGSGRRHRVQARSGHDW